MIRWGVGSADCSGHGSSLFQGGAELLWQHSRFKVVVGYLRIGWIRARVSGFRSARLSPLLSLIVDFVFQSQGEDLRRRVVQPTCAATFFLHLQ